MPAPPRPRRARPVADAPIAALLARSEELAKGWLLALIELAPLPEAPRILATNLSRDGPRLCDAVVRGLADDHDQRRLEPGGDLAPLAACVGELAACSTPAAISRAVDALRAVVWVALRSELRDPGDDLVGELAERLAQVTDLVRAAALSAHGQSSLQPHRLAQVAAGEPLPRRAWVAGERSAEEIAPAWASQLEVQIRRGGGAPLSVVLAELEDADKMLAVETEAGLAATFGAYAEAVRGAVRKRDILVSERGTRTWIIVPEAGRREARALGSRISSAVAQREPWRGAPLVASIGVAVLGEDGSTASELIGAAEEARFAASARGSR